MPSVTKWNVVPPAISIGACAWWVRTNTGWWYGGSGPHQPCHSSSPHSPRIGPNMLRPMIVAPTPSSPRAMKSSSRPVSPPSSPISARWLRVANAHACRRLPPTPSGCSRSWPGPAAKPSTDMAKLCTRSLVIVLVLSWWPSPSDGPPAGRRRRDEFDTIRPDSLRSSALEPVHRCHDRTTRRNRGPRDRGQQRHRRGHRAGAGRRGGRRGGRGAAQGPARRAGGRDRASGGPRARRSRPT